MVTSALTSLASGSAVSVINNGGNLGATLKDVTSSDSLKNYATGALTAGFTAGVLDPAFGVSGDNVNKVTKGFDLGSVTDIGRFAAYSGAQGVAQAAVGTALQGGSLNKNLGSALSSQLQSTLQAVAFNAVGDYSKDQQWADSGAQKVALHALVGGLLSQAGGGSFATGALAAGANEAMVSVLSKAVEGEPSLLLAASQLIGIAAAGATGGDVQKGAEIAKNATAYNYLNHHEADDLVKDLKGCRGAGDPTACRADVTAQYQRLSDTKTGLAMLQCEGYTNCNTLRTDVEGGSKALDDHGYSAGLSPQEQEIVRGFQDKNQDDLRLTVQKTTQATNGEVAGIVLFGGLGAGAKVVVKGGAASSGPKATTKVITEFGPMNQGPLPKGIADTFRSGTYSEVVTQQPTTLYRAYGGTAQELGGYWTATKPAGPVQSIIDSALKPEWGNTATKVVKIEVPIGTKYFEGVAAPQGGLVGGGNQVLFPKDFKIDTSWIKQ